MAPIFASLVSRLLEYLTNQSSSQESLGDYKTGGLKQSVMESKTTRGQYGGTTKHLPEYISTPLTPLVRELLIVVLTKCLMTVGSNPA